MAQFVKQQETGMTAASGDRQNNTQTTTQAQAATPVTPSSSSTPTKGTTAWIPKVKQQTVTEKKSAVVHDLGSDLMADGTDSASATTGKGKNRSKSKKMNWKPLPVPIIRRDPHDRDRDIRGSTRKYGFSGMGGGATGGKKQTNPTTITNGFRNNGSSSSPAAGPTAGSSTSSHNHHHNNNNNLSHQVNQNNSATTTANNNNNNSHMHHNNHHPHHPAVGQSVSAQSTGVSEDGKVLRSSSVSSSSSHSRRHQHLTPHHTPHSDQTPAPTSPTGESNHPHNQQSLSQHQPRLVNGSTVGNNRVSGRPPVLRSAAQSPPASPSQHQPQPHRKHEHHHQSGGGGYGRRGGVMRGSGSGRATPNSLKDFASPEVQYFPIEYAALNHDPSLMGNKTSGLMSPVLTLPAGTVVVPAPAFAGGPTGVAANSNLAPFYPPPVLPFTTMGPTGSPATVAVSTPSGLVPVSAFAMTPLQPVEPIDLREKIRAQIEYYFSPENLQRDIFIRKKMDSEGFLPISLIASFHRVQLLTQDVSVIIQSLEHSLSVELSDNHLKARPRDNPLSWPIVSESEPVLVAANKSSSNEIPLQTQMQQLTMSGAAGDSSAATTTGAPDDDVPSAQQSSPSSAVSEADASSSHSSSITTSSPSDAASLHPDVPCFVPGQLYAAVVGNGSLSTTSQSST